MWPEPGEEMELDQRSDLCFLLSTNPGGGYDHPHFTEEETEAQRRAVTCPGSQSRVRSQPLPSGPKPMLLASER